MATRPTVSVPAAWTLAWRQLLRDFRAGELRLLVVAVMLAVAALSAVGFFADRINGGLARDARQLLGGDAIVASDQPTPDAFTAKARELGLLTATTVAFPSMGRADDARGGMRRDRDDRPGPAEGRVDRRPEPLHEATGRAGFQRNHR